MRDDVLLTPELATRLAKVSADVRRALGVLVDRRGRITSVILGDARRLYLPDIGRQRGGGARFRGLRLIRTHLGGDALNHDDYGDLSKLQLDAIVSVDASTGAAGDITWAHLIPDNPQREMWRTHSAGHAAEISDTFSDFIRELESEFERKGSTQVATDTDAAVLVYVRLRGDSEHELRIAEMKELCRTAGVRVVETVSQSRPELDPKTAVGGGALEEIELRALQLGAGMLIFAQDLKPAQLRNIANRTNLSVVDRTQLILDIFAQRAQSRVGKLQVELAQLKYTLPRLSGRGTAMSRLAGGIGGRGPGETRLEVDRRRARDRIAQLQSRVEKLRGERQLRRSVRVNRGVPVIAIVGYTNAGKSTLLNRLTNSEVLSEDKLFATLDPTSRRLRVPSEREVILTDTVGFIRDLPDDLREAFRATLEELVDADLLLHVIDASDPAQDAHIASTERILAELEVIETPRLRVFNKIDRVGDEPRAFAPDEVGISAITGAGVQELLLEIDRRLVRMGHGDLVFEPD